MGSKKCTENDSWKEARQRAETTHRQRRLNRIEEYNKTPKLCGHCKVPLDYDRRVNTYCSSSCAASVTNKNNRKHGLAPEIRTCQVCNKEFKYYSNSSAVGKYCSQSCSSRGSRLEVFDMIDAGYTKATRLTYKKYLIEKCGYVCQTCGISEWMGEKISLELDHTDGDPSNNIITNLRLLCPNCHSQTPSWKGRNVGFGRGSRGMSLG